MESLDNQIVVSIQCLTYNHAPYIRQCLNGFVMQKTNFRFEAIVHDDASTDGTQNIIREYEKKYPDIIKPIYQKENQYSKGIPGRITNIVNAHCKGKYIAICEGDDYWTDPYKLQKQIDFLETHSDYTMCYHAVNYVSDDIVIGNDKRFENECDVSTEQMIEGGGGFCATCSLVFKKQCFYDFPNFRKAANIGDWPLQILLSIRGKVHFFPEIMGVYRKNIPGSWTSRVWKKDLSVPYSNNIEWLNVLNQETNRQYEESILKQVRKYLLYLLNHKKITPAEYAKHFQLFSIKSIFKVCGIKILLISRFPKVYSLLKNIN